jgi:hypothetical protein
MFGMSVLGESTGYLGILLLRDGVMLDVQDAPVPLMGSDGRAHVVYELRLTNFRARMPWRRKKFVEDVDGTLDIPSALAK